MIPFIFRSVFTSPAWKPLFCLVPCLLLAWASGCGTARAALPDYTVVDLGVLGGEGSESQATAVNALGQVVGWSGTAAGDTHAFLYQGGVMTDLGALPGGTTSYAAGVNDSGRVVGRSTSAGTGLYHAFLYENGVMSDLGLLPGGDTSQATGINNAGQIVGSAATASGTRAFLHEGGGLVNLGLPPDPLPSDLPPGATWVWTVSMAAAINASGRIAGSAGFLYNQPPTIANANLKRGFAYPESGNMLAFGPSPDAGYVTSAAAINASGLIVGNAYFTNPHLGPAHAFMRETDGTMHDLGTLGGDRSLAYGINASGWIVGMSRTAANQDAAFLHVSGVMVALASRIVGGNPFQRLEAALAINDSGGIVGSGLTLDGVRHAFLAVPVPVPGVQGSLPLLLLDD
jgi:probable HAF family extracellular repeat protein